MTKIDGLPLTEYMILVLKNKNYDETALRCLSDEELLEVYTKEILA